MAVIMGMVFTLRMISEMAVYFYFASFLGGLMGMQAPPMITLLVIALCCALSYGLKDRHAALRMLPFVLLLVWCGFFAGGWVDVLVPLPAALYAGFTCLMKVFEPAYDLRRRFITCLKVMPILFVFAIFPIKNTISAGEIIPQSNYVSVFSLPFGLLFLLVSVYLMRIHRHDEKTLKEPRLRIFNAIVLAVVCIPGMLFGKSAYTWITSATVFAYKKVIVPLATFIVLLFARIMTIISALLLMLARPVAEIWQDATETEAVTTEAVETTLINPDAVPQLDDSLINLVVQIIIIIAILTATALFFKYLFGKRRSATTTVGALEIRTALEAKRHAKKMNLLASDPREKIRRLYRSFLAVCKKNGLHVNSCDTSLSIQGRASDSKWCPEDHALGMREHYVLARYSAYEPTDLDVRAAKKHLNAIKSRGQPCSSAARYDLTAI